METIIDTFYNHVIPGLLSGKILCGIEVRIIANVLFKDNNKLFNAKSPVLDLTIPTLVINNKERLEKAIIRYCKLMANFKFYDIKKFEEALTNHNKPINEIDYHDKYFIEPSEMPTYIISCAIANMSEKDYANPEEYFEKLCYIQENNPINKHLETLGYIDSLKGDVLVLFEEEYPNQECPFVFMPYLKSDLGLYRFPSIRYYIIDNAVFVGAIQSSQSKKDETINKKVRRKIYRVNTGVDNENLSSVDPSVVCSLSMFLNYMSKYNTDKVSLLPYSLQRSNDKKIQLYHLKDIVNNPKTKDREKVIKIIKNTDTYFERLPHIRSQLETSLQRINHHYPNTEITLDHNKPSLLISDLTDCNNELLSELGTAINNKKTRL